MPDLGQAQTHAVPGDDHTFGPGTRTESNGPRGHLRESIVDDDGNEARRVRGGEYLLGRGVPAPSPSE